MSAASDAAVLARREAAEAAHVARGRGTSRSSSLVFAAFPWGGAPPKPSRTKPTFEDDARAAVAEARWVRWQRSHEQRHAVDYAHVSEKTDVTAPLRRVPGVRWGAGPPRCFSTAKAKRAARAKTEGVAAEAEARYLAQRGDPSTREMRHEIDHAHVDGRTDLATPMRRVPGVRWTRPTPTDASSPDASSERKRGDAAAAKERVAARSARAEARHVGKEGALARRGRQARHAVDYAHVEAKVDVAAPTGPVRGVRWADERASSGGVVRQGRLASPGARDEAAAKRTRAIRSAGAAEGRGQGGGATPRHPTRCGHCGAQLAAPGSAAAAAHVVECAAGRGRGNFRPVL